MKNLLLLSFLFLFIGLFSQEQRPDWVYEFPDGCTSITAGKLATIDGSVITSHTDDSHRTRSWMDIVPAKEHKKGDVVTMYKRTPYDSLAMPTYKHTPIGTIPQVKKTYQYLNTAYPSLNEKQLAMGESTFGGRDELQSDNGLIDCQRLCQLLLERESTARGAIKLAGELIKEYGWNDYGECLTIADKNEVWHLEIVGEGKGKRGGVWVAQRVPDDHIAVNCNASTIKEIDLSNSDYFMASENIFEIAKQNKWWNEGETFSFCHVYAPKSRESIAARRREWRIFDLLAPSLNLSPDDKDYPFSVKPDKKVTMMELVNVFKDYYQGTPYDMRNNIKATNKDGKTIISPLANPFMPYDQLELHGVNGGWFSVNKKTGDYTFLGERTIARWYTMYGTIIQLRNWLPDEVGGIVWLAQDNIANSVYIPVYSGTSDLPESYKTPGRPNGYTMKSAWWAFNRLGTIAAQRWGDMHKDLDAVWVPLQEELFEEQKAIDEEMSVLLQKNPKKAKEELTKRTMEKGNYVVEKAWELGDFLWTKYDELF